MIARVEFRPAEDWPSCHALLSKQFGGLPIEIDTSRPIKAPCGGRGWMVSEASKEMIGRTLHVEMLSLLPWWVCEHVLILGD